MSHIEGEFSSVKSKRSIVEVVNQDNLCFARSCVIGVARMQYDAKLITQQEYSKIHRGDRYEKQRLEAIKLQELAGIQMNRPCSLNDRSI